MKKIILFFSSLFLLVSCEKEIFIDLNSTDPKLVIEGEISTELKVHQVKITKTVNFSDPNFFPPVSGAIVTISDNLGFSEQLTENAPGIYSTNEMQGQSGRTYTLTVNYDSKAFIANSKLPNLVPLSDLFFQKNEFAPPSQDGTDTLYNAIPVFTDPVELGNNYRFVQIINGEKDKYFTVYDDYFINGLTNTLPIYGYSELKKGDEYTLEMRCIDQSTFDYFYSLNASAGEGPGGGTTPTNPVSNISGGAMGYFSAYTTQTLTKVVE